MARRRRPTNRYELLSCALRDHVLVGTEARDVEPEDFLFVREEHGIRWYRCLRCDSWMPMAPPDTPTQIRVPTRDEILLPARGPRLRSKYILRLIAVDRGIHVLVFGTLAAILFAFAQHNATLHRTYTDIMNALAGGSPGEKQVRGIFGFFGRAFKYSPHRLIQLGLLLSAYATLEACEMVGLWMGKRWAEYLTFVATTVFVPLEIYELSVGVSPLKLIALVLNLAIVIYLLFAKRLFGVRGGHLAVLEREGVLSGWPAVERATPHVGEPVGQP